MKCWHCDTELIWGSDNEPDSPDYDLETFLSCPRCHSDVVVYYPNQERYVELEGPNPASGFFGRWFWKAGKMAEYLKWGKKD